MEPVTIIAVVVFALVTVALYAAVGQREGRRRRALREAANAMGFAFDADADPVRFAALAAFPLCQRGRLRKMSNVMTGVAGDRETIVFDYEYAAGDNTVWRQTVAVHAAGPMVLPDFVLAPKNAFGKIGEIVGYPDIVFESNAVFSSRYLLRGREEAAIRVAFGAGALAFLQDRPGWNVEAQDGRVAVYRDGRRCEPENIEAFLAETSSVVAGLMDPARAERPGATGIPG